MDGNVTSQTKQREQWGTQVGFMLAAIGSAVGLGNIWKFPYITGENGGSAFIIVYLFAIALIGLPIMLSEFLIGRKTQMNAVSSFKELAPNKPWYLTGLMGVAAAFIILSFYGVVAGWALNYTFESLTGKILSVAPEELGAHFGSFISETYSPILWQLLFMLLVILIVVGGINKGIEKWNKFLMPTLALLIVIIAIRSVTLSGASAGLEFLLKPDFSALKPTSFLIALGHAFFSLSLGMGTMITYGSYVPKDQNLPKAALWISGADTLIALLAGLAIFPAVFAFNMEPNAGPGLVFITLPAIFQQLPAGQFFAILFFLLLTIAALTSAVSLLEVPVAYFSDKFNWSRKQTTWLIGTIIFVMGIPSSLSSGVMKDFKIFGKNFFDAADFLASNILLPLGGLLIALFVGWVMKSKDAVEAADYEEKDTLGRLWYYVVKFVAPVLIFLVLLNLTGILTKIFPFLSE
nr:sodium-dependent transporter [Vulcanibacillus modesticaldus]